ncbi:MAG: DUF4290 domain-containing protein [Bacteroidales bacterium]|nr:DUF4290 domain-containing protein [Bacteroidales bacterium]
MENNTNKHELILPEYGRNIQNMVEIAKKIEDRNERNRCARSIIDCMGNLFPYLRDNDNFKHKLWDHLALMSNFELDIDYPYDISNVQDNIKNPEAIPLPNQYLDKPHYGRFTIQFIKRIAKDTSITNRNELLLMIANFMKRCYSTFNQEIVDDIIILNDLYEISEGAIDLRRSNIRLTDMYYDKRNNKGMNKNMPNKKY